MNLDADLIDGELDKLQGIHNKLTVEEATKNGYVRVNATSKTGRRFSSEDKLPFRKVISSPGEFIEACKNQMKNPGQRHDPDADPYRKMSGNRSISLPI